MRETHARYVRFGCVGYISLYTVRSVDHRVYRCRQETLKKHVKEQRCQRGTAIIFTCVANMSQCYLSVRP